MHKIDEEYCELLGCEFDLYKTSLSKLKELSKTWYDGEDFSKFDNRHVREKDEDNFIEMKKSGLMSNFFFAYVEDGKTYLLDGFNRLFTDYGDTSKIDPPVYVKVISRKLAEKALKFRKLEDNELMHIMFRLNMWKLHEKGYGGFETKEFLDRGFRLFLKKKFDIEISDEYGKDFDKVDSDFYWLRNYFIGEMDYCGDFTFNFDSISILFSHKNVVNDFREILSLNKWEAPFKNYHRFTRGFIMFLAYKRVTGDNSEIKFDTYLEKLKADKKFFTKLQGMSWTDSTRRNVYKFFRDIK